ncbi:hypothetical protein KQX54_002755 [Cotesia glomerata]|uniref:Uncharacterized protein n=1 Tax=Cotesia glomerata TaxID=32391 RepID=A0AAV7IZF6_COTGL|nr:hypothetical protein KQX54_002755 [Cotesia glomerata]
MILAVACSVTAAALRGVAIQRGRVGPAARAAFPAGAALALARNPGPLAAAAAATALHPFASTVYYDPFLAAHAATQDPNYRLQAKAPALEVGITICPLTLFALFFYLS